jgi:hypothetical protein
MIGEVASLVGGEQDPAARAMALAKLDRAADRLNASGIFMFMRKTETYDSLVASQETLDLPADWGWPCDPADVYDAGGNLIKRMEWTLWDTYRATIIDPYDAVPSIISLRSELDETASIFPRVDAGSVGSIQLNYWARIQRPSEAEYLSLLPEAREALITVANFLATQHRYLKSPAVWEPMRRDAFNMVELAKGAAQRWLGACHLTIYPELSGYASQYSEHTMTNSRLGIGPAFIKIG